MIRQENNYAFIDGSNLFLATQGLGWKLDFKKFRIYLREKYRVKKAYYFIGYVDGNNSLYSALQDRGYILIFKPTFRDRDGNVKGNCDAELVLQAMIDYQQYDKAVIVTGDGDFYCLVQHLHAQNKLETVLVPDYRKYSGLLKKTARNKLAFVNNLRYKLEYKKRSTQ